jgi:hypothetical protein
MNRCREDMTHIRQSRPDAGIGVQAKVLQTPELSPVRSEAALKRISRDFFGGGGSRVEGVGLRVQAEG